MKKLNEFMWMCIVVSLVITVLIVLLVWRPDDKISLFAIVAIGIVCAIWLIILIILLLIIKEILPDLIQEENTSQQLLAKLISESKVEADCKNLYETFSKEIRDNLDRQTSSLSKEIAECKETIKQQVAQITSSTTTSGEKK